MNSVPSIIQSAVVSMPEYMTRLLSCNLHNYHIIPLDISKNKIGQRNYQTIILSDDINTYQILLSRLRPQRSPVLAWCLHYLWSIVGNDPNSVQAWWMAVFFVYMLVETYFAKANFEFFITDCFFFSITQLSHLMSFYFLAHDLNVTVTSHFTSAALSAIMSLLQSWST